MQFTSKRASIPTAVCIRGVVHKSGPCAPHPGCLLTLPPSLPPQLFLSPSLLVSLKKPARGWLPISHEKPFTHTSAPSLINQGSATWQWECRQAVFTSSVRPPEPLFSDSDTYWCQAWPKADWHLQTHFSDLGRGGLTKASPIHNSSSPPLFSFANTFHLPSPRQDFWKEQMAPAMQRLSLESWAELGKAEGP